MRIELRKENKVGEPLWYGIYIDDKYITGSYDLKKAEKLYYEVKDSSVEETIILKSEEIGVSSQSN